MNEIYKRAFSQLIDFLEHIEKDQNIKYYLVGGVLVNIYTVFRTTQDIDFAVDIESEGIMVEEYVSYLEEGHFNPLQDWKTAIELAKKNKMLQYFDESNYVKFDNYLIDRDSPSKYKKIGPIGLKRRIRKELFGKKCWVLTKEDFILSKLVFGGWQDYADALGCWLRFKEDLDLNYLREMSKDLQITKKLELLTSGITDPDEYFEKLQKK
jgi:hypothetical protein